MQRMQSYRPLNELKVRRNPFRAGRNGSPRQLRFLLQLQRTINYSARSRHSARSHTLSPSQFYAPESIKGLQDLGKLCGMLNHAQLLLLSWVWFLPSLKLCFSSWPQKATEMMLCIRDEAASTGFKLACMIQQCFMSATSKAGHASSSLCNAAVKTGQAIFHVNCVNHSLE